ncbi:MAG: hypothetical protein JOY62_01220 [Acidobacteriaceae bacterium]|nr:hypothetical protein [Acidobacteriaceae bacterium]
MPVMLKVGSSETAHECEVTVVFSRADNLAPLEAHDVEAQLLDARGTPLQLLERPSGNLVEFGGTLGNSVNALFRFQSSGGAPSEALVSYRGESVRFQIVAANAK